MAARQLNRPVKLRLDRDDDFLITGRRHCFWYEYEVGYDDEGRVLGAEITMVSRAGHSADLSGPVMTRALCHFDNAYWLPDVAMHGYSGKTNTQSNTAFRGFGGPQGAIAIEAILDSIARRLGNDALDVRRANFLHRGGHQVACERALRIVDRETAHLHRSEHVTHSPRAERAREPCGDVCARGRRKGGWRRLPGTSEPFFGLEVGSGGERAKQLCNLRVGFTGSQRAIEPRGLLFFVPAVEGTHGRGAREIKRASRRRPARGSASAPVSGWRRSRTVFR